MVKDKVIRSSEGKFSTWSVTEDGFVVDEKPKTIEKVLEYVLAELKKADVDIGTYDYFNPMSPHPDIDTWPLDYRWIACFAVVGANEGWYIHVVAFKPGKRPRTCEVETLLLGKTFQSIEHALELVVALTKILQ
jgi:hypothetical protein